MFAPSTRRYRCFLPPLPLLIVPAFVLCYIVVAFTTLISLSADEAPVVIATRDLIPLPPRPPSFPLILPHVVDWTAQPPLYCVTHPADCADAKETHAIYSERVRRLRDADESNVWAKPSAEAVNAVCNRGSISVWYDAWIYEWWPQQMNALAAALHECPVKCEVSKEWAKADIITTMMEEQYTPTNRAVTVDRSRQCSAVLSTESYAGVGPTTHPIQRRETEKSDFLVSYDRRADVFINYFYALTGDGVNGQSRTFACDSDECIYQWTDGLWNGEIAYLARYEQLIQEPKYSGVFISKCMPTRENYLKALAQYAPFDSYGTCMRTPGLSSSWNDPFGKARESRKYLFHFAFENQILPDYVTEKFFTPFLYGVLMVYWGAPNIADYAPAPHSFINALDFAGADELGRYLQQVRGNRTLYESYFQWRRAGDESRQREAARLVSLRADWSARNTSAFARIPVSPHFLRLRESSLMNSGSISWQCRLCQSYHHRYCKKRAPSSR